MRVAVDDGHGLGSRERGVIDPGAEKNGYQEYQVAAVLGGEERAAFARQGILTMKPVGIYTTRDQQADAWGAELFVSNHLNQTAGARGVEVFVHTGACARSWRLARAISAEVARILVQPDRGAKQADFAVLAGRSPAVLIEWVFIDNAADVAHLVAKRRECAEAVVRLCCKEMGWRYSTTPAPQPFSGRTGALVADVREERAKEVVGALAKLGIDSRWRGGSTVIEDKALQGRILDAAAVHAAGKLARREV